MYRERQIAYETETHWVIEVKPGYFEIYIAHVFAQSKNATAAQQAQYSL